MLKSCLKPSLAPQSNQETPSSKLGIRWATESQLSKTKLFYKDSSTSACSKVFEEDIEMEDSTSTEVPILGALYTEGNEIQVGDDEMDKDNINSTVFAAYFQDTMGTDDTFHTLLAQYEEHLHSEQQKQSQVGLRPWENPSVLEEPQWHTNIGGKGKAPVRSPKAQTIAFPIPPIAFFNNQGQTIDGDDDVDMNDAESPPDLDEEDQLEDNNLLGPPSTASSSSVPAPYIEPLEEPLNAKATAVAKTRAREAYYGRHRKPIIQCQPGTRDRARAKQSASKRLKSIKKRLKKAVKNGVPVSYVQPTKCAETVLYSTSGKRFLVNRKGAGAGKAVAGPSRVVGADGRTFEPMKPSRMIEWVADLHHLKGEAERGLQNTTRYAGRLEAIIRVIEEHETHPDFTVQRLVESGLFKVLKDFQHTNGGRGPGLRLFKDRVIQLCARWREKLNSKED